MGAMYTKPEVDFVVLFEYNEYKARAFDEAFKWIKPTLCPMPTIEEGPVEWQTIDDINFSSFYTMGMVHRPVTVSFEQEASMNSWTIKRTEEYKFMLYFIHYGFKEYRLYNLANGADENLKAFLLKFFNEHTKHEDYEILLNIIFILAEGQVVDLHEVVDAICETENKEALVVLLKKADEMDYYKYKGQPTGRFNL
jgi:hypothetical protein